MLCQQCQNALPVTCGPIYAMWEQVHHGDSPSKKIPESSWGLKNVKEDRTPGVCMCKCEKCKYRPWNVCVPGCVITSGTVTARKGHRPWGCCVEGYGWKGAGKGRPPTQRNPHLPSLVSLLQLYMLTVRVNVHITQRSIPGCQDVGVGHRGQM